MKKKWDFNVKWETVYNKDGVKILKYKKTFDVLEDGKPIPFFFKYDSHGHILTINFITKKGKGMGVYLQ